MIQNFLLTATRNFIKNKYFVLINVTGLGLSLACCIVAWYNYQFQAEFDGIQKNRDRIYKINIKKEVNGKFDPFGITPVTLKPAIGESLSGVSRVVRVDFNSLPVRYNEKIAKKNLCLADKDFFNLFTYTLLKGDLEGFQTKEKVIVTNEFANYYFGDNDPVGKIVTIYNNKGEPLNFMIAGVIADIPDNSSIVFDIVMLYDNFFSLWEVQENDWKTWTAATFLEIPDKGNVSAIEKSLAQFVSVQNDARKDWLISSFYLVSMKDYASVSRDTRSEWLRSGLHPAQLVAPGIMAMLILLLACFNYMNTSIAISSRRLREIGIRKVVGGTRTQMIWQFMGENFILCFAALLIALAAGNFLIGQYCALFPYMDLKMNLADIKFWGFLVSVLIITSLLAGTYPALHVSRFNPIEILKGSTRITGTNALSKILLILQFTIAIIGIIAAVIFNQNANYQEQFPVGYQIKQIISIPMEDKSRFELYKNSIQNNPKITQIGSSEHNLGWGSYRRTLEYGTKKFEVSAFNVGLGYVQAMGLELKQGRDFETAQKQTDISKSILVNEKFADDLGLKNPLGEKFRLNDTTELTIVGVIKDFYPWGCWRKLDPIMFRLSQDKNLTFIVVQANINNLTEVNDYLKTEWEKLIPNYPYEGLYQTEVLKEQKDINGAIQKIFLFLGFLSMAISLIGFYTLISLNIIKRTKEIGIRKIMGAPISRIIVLLNHDLYLVVGVSAISGSVSGYYLSQILMGSIWELHVSFSFLSVVLTVLFTFAVSFGTISWKVYKAASQNPVDAIKYE